MAKTFPFSKLSDEWRKDPEFMREYDALEEEFALAAALIRGRTKRPEMIETNPQPARPELVEGPHLSSCRSSSLRKKNSPSTSSG